VDPLTTADIDRRRSRLLGSVFVLLAAFASLSVCLSFLGSDVLSPLQLTPTAARLGLLALTAGFVALVFERDRALRRLAAQRERQQLLTSALKNRLDVLESLLDAGDRLNAPLSVPDVMDVLLACAIELAGAEGGGVTALDAGDGDISVARRHSVAVDPSALAITEVVDYPLEVNGDRVGTLSLALPFDRDDPVISELLAAFGTRAAVALRRAQVMSGDRASLAYLQAANVVKSRFLQTVSHELRTPLTSIVGYSSTLERHWERLPDKMRREFTRSINEQGGRLKMLVERILEAARVELEGVTVRPVVHDVRRSVERALAEFSHDVERVHMAVPDRPVTGEVDPFVVEQVVQNLVDNGLRYTSGLVRVSLDVYRSTVVIGVTDEGPGMADADLKLVVEPLFRIDENVNSGTGLGLHIVRTLVADHGGRLDIASGRDGTNVQVSLPRSVHVTAQQEDAHSTYVTTRG
jgi:K+-sensing histidine kinase KdpD